MRLALLLATGCFAATPVMHFGAGKTPEQSQHAIMAKETPPVLGSDTEKQATFDGLDSVASHLRSRVARQLRLRVAPEIQFKEDDTIARAARIESLLADVKKRDSAAARGSEDD